MIIKPLKPKTMINQLIDQIMEFNNYVLEFYNDKDGIYPIATPQRISEAITEYISSKPLNDMYWDSFDREGVRKIIEPDYSIFI